jgi:hypothetical protein
MSRSLSPGSVKGGSLGPSTSLKQPMSAPSRGTREWRLPLNGLCFPSVVIVSNNGVVPSHDELRALEAGTAVLSVRDVEKVHAP